MILVMEESAKRKKVVRQYIINAAFKCGKMRASAVAAAVVANHLSHHALEEKVFANIAKYENYVKCFRC